MSGTPSDELITGNTMIKELAKKIVRDRRMNSAIDSAEKHSDYLISLYESKLLINLASSKKYPSYDPETLDTINNDLQNIKDNNSRELLLKECSQILLMNSLEEII